MKKEKNRFENLYNDMVYTASLGSSGSSGNSSGSSNSSTESGNIGLPLGNLTLNSSISQSASMTNVDYSASCPNAANIMVTLNHYPSDAVAYSNNVSSNSIRGTFTNVAAGGYMLKAVAKRGAETKSKESYTYIRDNPSLPLGSISLDRTVSEESSFFDVNYSVSCPNADNICVSLNDVYSSSVIGSNSASNSSLEGIFRNIVEGDYLLKATASKRNGESKSTQIYTALKKTYNCSYCNDKGWIGSVSCSHCDAYLTNMGPISISVSNIESSVYGNYNISIFASCVNAYEMTIELRRHSDSTSAIYVKSEWASSVSATINNLEFDSYYVHIIAKRDDKIKVKQSTLIFNECPAFDPNAKSGLKLNIPDSFSRNIVKEHLQKLTGDILQINSVDEDHVTIYYIVRAEGSSEKPVGTQLLRKIIDNKNTTTIISVYDEDNGNTSPDTNCINVCYDLHSWLPSYSKLNCEIHEKDAGAEIVLGHELIHALHHLMGNTDNDTIKVTQENGNSITADNTAWPSEELNTVGINYWKGEKGNASDMIYASDFTYTENKLRIENLYGLRYDYIIPDDLPNFGEK